MKRRIAALSIVAALSAAVGLSACGGGGGGSDSPSAPKAHDVAALSKTDTVVGTGAEVLPNATVTVNYTLWLYDPAAAGMKGTHIQGPSPLTRSLTTLIPAWQQGVPGMKVGGKRTLLVPSSLGYGAAGSGDIPGNSGLVFDIELTGVTNVYDAPALVKTDTLVGTGAEVTAGKSVRATYTLWLYDGTKPNFKGNLLEGPNTSNFTLANGSIIAGWVQGVPGMKVGGKRTLIVPSSLAYGTTGTSSGSVPPNSGLVFDIEIGAINN